MHHAKTLTLLAAATALLVVFSACFIAFMNLYPEPEPDYRQFVQGEWRFAHDQSHGWVFSDYGELSNESLYGVITQEGASGAFAYVIQGNMLIMQVGTHSQNQMAYLIKRVSENKMTLTDAQGHVRTLLRK